MGKFIVVVGLLALALAIVAIVTECPTDTCSECMADHCVFMNGGTDSYSCCCGPDTGYNCVPDSGPECTPSCPDGTTCFNNIGNCTCG